MASQLIARNARNMINNNKWYILSKWQAQLPEAVVQESPELLLNRAWIHFMRFENDDILPVIDQIDKLTGGGEETHDHFGLVLFLRGHCFFISNDGASALEYIEHSLEHIPETDTEFRGFAESEFGLVGHMQGQMNRVISQLLEWLNDSPSSASNRKSRLLQSINLIHLVNGNLEDAEGYIILSRNFAIEQRIGQAIAWCDYIEGLINLQQGKFELAIRLLEQASNQKYILHTRVAFDSLVALVIAYQANGQPKKATNTIQSLYEFTAKLSPYYKILTDSFSARFNLMQDRTKPAVHWLKMSTPPDVEVMMWWKEIPCVTHCRILIAEQSTTALKQSEEKLRAYADMNTAHHNTLQLIEILVLLSMTLVKQKKTEEALKILKKALMLIETNGFIFPFLEQGPPMAKLINKLSNDIRNKAYVSQIIDNFKKVSETTVIEPKTEQTAKVTTQQDNLHSLSARELVVLSNVAKGLRNKEIAAKLFVSEDTIKKHLYNMFQKLDVSNRTNLVRKSKELGLLDVN
jgi:LuxR family maltose regulon positive regulatory protein